MNGMNEKMVNKIVVGLFLGFIGIVALMQIFTKDVDFSEAENRVLAEMPDFSIENFISGDFMKEFEVYVSDQFAGKEVWTGLKASAEKARGQQENNGVYFGDDGYLLERFAGPGEQFLKNIGYVNGFLDRAEDVASYVMLVPTAIEVYPEKMPAFAQSSSQQAVLDEVEQALHDAGEFVDVLASLVEAKDEELYFRTDHHWTTRGAYVAYVELMEQMGIEPFGLDDFTVQTVSRNFLGTHYAKAGDSSMQPDVLEIFQPKADISYHVDIDNGQTEMDGLYAWEYLEKRDQYALFLGGNNGLVKVTSSVGNGEKLMVIKDSYAHALVPFLANHFEEIHVIDLRYYRGNVREYLAENEIDDALFLYNVVNFAEDTNMIWLRQ